MLYFVFFSSLYLLFNKSKLWQIDYLGWENRLLVIVLFLFEGVFLFCWLVKSSIIYTFYMDKKNKQTIFDYVYY